MLLMLLDRLLRRQVHRRTRQLRSLGRLQELLWWCMVGVRARLVVLLRMQRRLLVDRLLHRLVRLLRLRSMAMRGTRASMRHLRMAWLEQRLSLTVLHPSPHMRQRLCQPVVLAFLRHSCSSL